MQERASWLALKSTGTSSPRTVHTFQTFCRSQRCGLKARRGSRCLLLRLPSGSLRQKQYRMSPRCSVVLVRVSQTCASHLRLRGPRLLQQRRSPSPRKRSFCASSVARCITRSPEKGLTAMASHWSVAYVIFYCRRDRTFSLTKYIVTDPVASDSL